MKVLTTLFHLAAATSFVGGFVYDQLYVTYKGEPAKIEASGAILKGRLLFLTCWCLLIQASYFTICVINDFTGTNDHYPKYKPLVRKIKDYVYAALAFPIAMNVGISFWTLMAIDRELVFPKAFDEFFPNWLNHVMHTNIMIFIMLEIFVTFRQYPSRAKGLAGLSVFMLGYLVWLHVVKEYSGIWVYPVLDVLNFPSRIAFFIGMLIFSVGLYILGEKINNVYWVKELRASGKSKVK